MALQQLKFQIVYCSGEEADHPATELYTTNPNGIGWESERFCDYPQEIGLRFQGVSRLTKVQLMAHPYMIPSKVELFIGSPESSAREAKTPEKEYKRAVFTRLGKFSFEMSKDPALATKQLKTATVDSTGLFLKICLHKCHPIKKNVYNQVGLIAISLLGESLSGRTSAPPVQGFLPHLPVAPPYGGDLSYQMLYDPLTAQALYKLERLKEKAVKDENYDLATRLKHVINGIKDAAKELGKLESLKQEAIATEDYELAKKLKVDIDNRRNEVLKRIPPEYQAGDRLGVRSGPPSREGRDKEDAFLAGPARQRPRSQPPPLRQGAPELNGPVAEHGVGQLTSKPKPAYLNPDDRPLNVGLGKPMMPDERPIRPRQPNDMIDGMAKDAAPARALQQAANPDDRPIRPAESSPFSNKPSSPDIREVNRQRRRIDVNGEGPSDPGEPEEIPETMKEEVAPLLDILPERDVRGIFSSKWQHRDAALKSVASQLDALNQAHEPMSVFKTICTILRRVFDDRNAQVLLAAFDLLSMLLAASSNLKKSAVFAELEPILALVSEKIGDSNARLREAAIATLRDMQNQVLVGADAVARQLLKPTKSRVWRLYISRMELLQNMIRNGEAPSVTTTAAVMKFVLPLFSHQNNEVRGRAMDLTAELYRRDGNAVEAHLKELKGPVLDALHKKFEEAGPPPANPPQQNPAGRKQEERDVLEKPPVQKKPPPANKTKKQQEQPPTEPATVMPAEHAPIASEIVEEWEEKPFTCPYCGRRDEQFDESGLDRHYLGECPMLTECIGCSQIVEIRELNEHQLEECKQRAKFKACSKCLRAIPAAQAAAHEGRCTIRNTSATIRRRCPLCGEKISGSTLSVAAAWRQHLTVGSGCSNNPRPL